jgi:adenylate cyclase
MLKLTLNRVFALSLIGLLAGLGLLFWLVFHGLQTALLESAEQAREKNSAVIADSVTRYLSQAPAAATDFENLLRAGLTNPADPHSLRNGLLSVLLGNPDISEATFTFARSSGFDPRNHAIIDPATVGQVTLFHPRTGSGFACWTTWYVRGRFLSAHLHLSPDGKESGAEPPVVVPNPADHPTFRGPTLRRLYGRLLWTDVHWFANDGALPEARRRVEVSVLKAIESPPGQFAGVLRIGLFKDAIDDAIAMPPAVDTKTHSIFLCDSGDTPGSGGRLIAISGSNRYVDSDGDLRLSAANAPPQVQAALRRPALATVDDDHPLVPDQFVVSGTTFLCTFRSLPGTQDWIVGMVVPRRAYLEVLLKTRGQVVWGSLALAAAIAFFGGIVLRSVSIAHSVIVREAALMNDFVLDPSSNSCNFQDINRVLASLERAKTAMRSMGKYVPMDLVRRLYHRGEEPRLGGETTELSVLFTDIQSFTAFAETTDPHTLAVRLGAYLEVLASVIQREKGTIDKFIGDSVMAFWNAPEPVPGHAALACRAALAGREALALLYRSPAWGGNPGFETRFGLHRCTASVGHFGSPERFNYTAIGDGINLASRLQSLNKHYGTSIMASASLREAAGPGFQWRRLDRVAVKGKTQSLDVYELLGESTGPLPAHVGVYEEALEAWLEGDFAKALALAESQPLDRPSVFLAARSREYLAAPPPKEWDGVYAFDSK